MGRGCGGIARKEKRKMNLKKRRILLIDDDRELCDELWELFSQEGYAIEVAYDGLDAKKLIEKDAYDLVIADLKLPGLSGVDLLKFIKVSFKNTKVFIISGKPFIDDMLKEESTKNLADGVISKPFEIEEVLARIKSVLQ